MDAPGLKVIYHDKFLVVVNKPAGLLVHRSAIDYHEPHNAQEQLQALLSCKVFPVHRLDKPTSGVLLFALNKDTASALALQFQQHEVLKNYIAVVRGHAALEGSIDNPVRDKDAPGKPKKPAVTHYKTLAQMTLPLAVDKYPQAQYSLLELQPQSGRRHQLRLHMKHISHPIIGDTSYGKSVHNRFFKDHLNTSRLLLHAQQLTISHPATGKVTCFSADHDAQFQQILAMQQWHWNIDQAEIAHCKDFSNRNLK